MLLVKLAKSSILSTQTVVQTKSMSTVSIVRM